MGFTAEVRNVLIASPGDVADKRDTAREVIRQWNESNAKSKKIILMPCMWEHHTYSTTAQGGQAAINQQLLSTCDMAIAIFGNRLGKATEEFASGTVEEIERLTGAGKQVMVFFSNEPITREQIKDAELAKLEAFKKERGQRYYYCEYNSLEDFKAKLENQLRNYMNGQTSNIADSAQKLQDADQTKEPQLSDCAQEILITTSRSNNGTLSRTRNCNLSSGDVGYRTERQEILAKDAREAAMLDAAVDELVNAHMLKKQENNFFTLTKKGYEMADCIIVSQAEHLSENAKKQLLKIADRGPGSYIEPKYMWKDVPIHETAPGEISFGTPEEYVDFMGALLNELETMQIFKRDPKLPHRFNFTKAGHAVAQKLKSANS